MSLGALALLHPFPSLLNAVLAGALAAVAGADAIRATILGSAMFALQASIGSLNDLADATADRLSKPYKPIAAGLVTSDQAMVVGGACALLGMGAALAVGGPVVALAGAALLAAGLLYDFWLKPTPYAGLCYAVAFVAVPVFGWWGGGGTLPPRSELLLPIAALAGPTLQLANGLVDAEHDRRSGLHGPVVRLGTRRTLRVLSLLQGVIHLLAWGTLLTGPPVPPISLGALAAATGMAALGLVGSASHDTSRREAGWKAQAASIVILAVGWLFAVSGDTRSDLVLRLGA